MIFDPILGRHPIFILNVGLNDDMVGYIRDLVGFFEIFHIIFQ